MCNPHLLGEKEGREGRRAWWLPQHGCHGCQHPKQTLIRAANWPPESKLRQERGASNGRGAVRGAWLALPRTSSGSGNWGQASLIHPVHFIFHFLLFLYLGNALENRKTILLPLEK